MSSRLCQVPEQAHLCCGGRRQGLAALWTWDKRDTVQRDVRKPPQALTALFSDLD